MTQPAIRFATAIVSGALCVLALGPGAHAQSGPIRDLNRFYQDISNAKRSDRVLLPALVDLEPAPQAMLNAIPVERDVLKAMLLPVGAGGWAEAEAWATAPAQVAALAALRRATDDESGDTPMAFGQPYGVEAVADEPGGIDLIAENLYTNLGDPPLLADPRFGYLPKFRTLVVLAHVEATRLAGQGEISAAIEQMIDLLYLGRQFAGREYTPEMQWGMRIMTDALERIRDLAYTDKRGERKLSSQMLVDLINRLDDRSGFLRIDRLTFPRAEHLAALQVHGSVFNSGGVTTEFGRTMARINAGEHKLALFSQIPRWQQLGASHRGSRETRSNINSVYNDYSLRWSLDYFDPRLGNQSYKASLSPLRDAMVVSVFDDDSDDLFTLRRIIDAEIAGTRSALGVLAFQARAGSFPPQLAAIRPRYVAELDDDPYNPTDRERGGQPPLEFFTVESRNRTSEVNFTYEVNIDLAERGAPNFRAPLDETHFVIYSVGPDGNQDWARNVREDLSEIFTGDYLVWPPVVSLYRQHLRETGTIR